MTRRRNQPAAARPTASLLARITTPDEPAPPWSLTSAAITVVFAFILVVIGTLFAFTWGGEATSPLIGWIVSGALIAGMVWQIRARDREALRLGAPTLPVPLIAFIAIGLALALDLIGLAVTGAFLPIPALLGFSSGLDVVSLLLAGLLVILIQPIAEELLFRGMVLPAARAALGGWAGLILTAVASGAFHWLVYTPSITLTPEMNALTPYWYGFIAPTLAALVYSVARIGTRSTRGAIAAHIAFGAFALIKLLIITG
jgi:membrane protease YdiL (CAAX protease family)